jgi:protein-tyrosine-phosphatase
MNTEERAARFAALGDPTRLRIVESLAVTDRSPGEMAAEFGIPGNLMAHHLDVLEDAGLVGRTISAGDRRRRYIHLARGALDALTIKGAVPAEPVLFVCTHNSARSQLAAALWTARVGTPATSAGTHPAPRVHPGAVSAAKKAGLDLSEARPRHLDDVDTDPVTVVTVCDQAHEELPDGTPHRHWSTPDPALNPTRRSFDRTLTLLQNRIDNFVGGQEWSTIT